MALRLLLALTLAAAAYGTADQHVRQALIQNAELRIAARNAWLSVAEFRDMSFYKAPTLALVSPYYSCPWSLVRGVMVSEVFDGAARRSDLSGRRYETPTV